jgi:hypothetical protein
MKWRPLKRNFLAQNELEENRSPSRVLSYEENHLSKHLRRQLN